ATLPMCRERKIAYATLTAIEIRRTGQAFLAEFDAPGALLLRDLQPVRLERTPRRVGQRPLTINEAHFWMQENDYLVCVTDGVIHAGIGAKLALGLGEAGLQEFLQARLTPNMTAQEVADRITEYVHYLYNGKPGDDATTLVLKIRKPKRLMVLVGPPKDRALDKALAHKLAYYPGTKVVCGGTTAKLVARELGRQIEIDLEQFPVEHPPTGQIEGIDLVTEGIITLCGAAQFLENKNQDHQEDSPAVLLGQMLLASDYIDFHVGGAINPAHQNPELPFDLALKQQVVNKIAAALAHRGKRVQVQLY
ncbi:MAG: SpoIIE family protein phosphatase, partial [Limnochordia bacterium]|nr:SpoIIE family protein phosphatase [Limnochordia bacterium]